MKILLILTLSIVAAGSAVGTTLEGTTAETTTPTAEHVAELIIRATLPNGSPAVGVPVHEVGPARHMIRNSEVGATDGQGEFRVGFQPGYHDRSFRPVGYGMFRYILKPEGMRWELSDIYGWREYDADQIAKSSAPGLENHGQCAHWFKPGYDGLLDETDPANNWSYGKGVPVRAGDRLVWAVQLQQGPTCKVCFVDQFDVPIANAEVEVGLDLRASTRTLLGAQVEQRTICTDDEGCALIDNASDFSYQFDVKGQPFFAPDLSYSWGYANHNMAVQGSTVRFQRLVAQNLRFRVTEMDSGKPVSGAALYEEISFPPFCQGGPLDVATDESGELYYDKPIELEHVCWFKFVKEGYEDGIFKMEDYVEGEVLEVALRQGTSQLLESLKRSREKKEKALEKQSK